jgi:hypothetical protein
MNQQTIEELIALNNRFYAENSSSFSATRSSPWRGWVEGLEILAPALKKAALPITVTDFAAGNLRFEKYFEEVLPKTATFQAIDNCSALLPPNFTTQVTFHNLNIIEELQKLGDADKIEALKHIPLADLTVCFGFMHHIPTPHLRTKLLEALIDNTAIGGHIFVSFWGFANSEKGAMKALTETSQFFVGAKNSGEVHFSTDDLGAGDYIIGWQNSPNAFRYCHSFTSEEVHELIRNLQVRIELVSEFSADGKDNQQNHYIILRKIT